MQMPSRSTFKLDIGESAFSVEACLMLYCARIELDDRTRDEIARLSKRPLDWPHFLSLAKTQRVLPLMYHNLTRTIPEEIPPVVLQEMKQYYYYCGVQNALHFRDLVDIIRVLN